MVTPIDWKPSFERNVARPVVKKVARQDIADVVRGKREPLECKHDESVWCASGRRSGDNAVITKVGSVDL